MSADHRAELARITCFDQLIAFLRDKMEWRIDSDDFEEITFDYSPEELGIDAANAATIQEIKRLRPMAANQPWGIFFVKFESKRLPIVALRRILSRVVLKKRAAANSDERAAWQMADLLFISNYGDTDQRRISFAHFVQDDDWGDLPTLKVLGWDGDDTNLHLDDVARKLTNKLRWPDDEADVAAWRDTWAEAFTLRHGEVITTAKRLAERLADLARETRKKANSALAIESSTGPLRTLMDAFKKALIHDLDEDGFADMYAQTIAYGLLSARISRPEGLTADNIADMVPITNPFLKEMLESFLRLGGRRRAGQGWTGIDFDELGINEIVQLLREANMEAVLLDFGDRNPQEDPVIHFYEHFLKEYDARKRMQRGVFYTPRPVVSYIVRSVHELLQTEFGLTDGLADTATWGEMLEKHTGLKLPPLSDSPGEKQTISPDEPFVQILDPATGTATFMVEVIDVIHQTLKAKWKGQRLSEAQQSAAWNDYVPRHLLPRLHAFELMMAPYAIAHMKIGLKLAETGYRFGSDERARVYLTNALEPWVRQLSLIGFEALAHEAAAVNEVKKHKHFTVVIGNPPYSVTSANFNPFINGLMDDYKKHVRGEQGLVALADDYLKFVRLSQQLVAASNCGVWGMITNHGYLKGVIHRGVRKELLNHFKELFVLDLHGDSNIGERVPVGKANDNVFDIQQGVAVSIGVRSPVKAPANAVHYCDIWGNRSEKYADLITDSVSRSKWTCLRPVEPQLFLIPFDDANLAEYIEFPSLIELMAVNSCGVKTHRDGVVIDYDKNTLVARMSDIASEHCLELLRDRYGIVDTPNWKLEDAQNKITEDEVPQFIQRLTYRPFDYRWIYYNPKIIEKGDSKYPTLRHMLHSNVALLSARIQATGIFDAVFVSKFLVEMKTAESSRSCTVFPLFLKDDSDSGQGQLSSNGPRPNLNPKILLSWSQKLGILPTQDFGLPVGLTPEDILHYAYAIFHSPGYRSRYAEFLKIDFPRLPLTGHLDLLRALTQLGGELVALHLLESPTLDQPITELIGHRNPEVEKPAWSQDTVWVDKRQTTGFKGVPEAVWNFHIGGYRVCHKWLNYRKGRTLSNKDIAHYHKIVVALNETIRLMQEIDEVIEQHGGWPHAFAVNTRDQS